MKRSEWKGSAWPAIYQEVWGCPRWPGWGSRGQAPPQKSNAPQMTPQPRSTFRIKISIHNFAAIIKPRKFKSIHQFQWHMTPQPISTSRITVSQPIIFARHRGGQYNTILFCSCSLGSLLLLLLLMLLMIMNMSSPFPRAVTLTWWPGQAMFHHLAASLVQF